MNSKQTANGGEPLRTAAKARERLFTVRFMKLRMARIVDNEMITLF